MSYCTLNDLKTYLGIETDDDDVLLSSSISRAQQAIDTHCRRTFEALEDSTKYLDAVEDVDGRMLYLTSAGELCSITSITNGDEEELESSDYVTEPRNDTPYYAIRLLASSDISWTYDEDPENAITVVGKWAYSESAPDDIVQAAIRLASWLYHQKDNSAEMERPIVAGVATILPAQLPQDITNLLAPYRKLL